MGRWHQSVQLPSRIGSGQLPVRRMNIELSLSTKKIRISTCVVAVFQYFRSNSYTPSLQISTFNIQTTAQWRSVPLVFFTFKKRGLWAIVWFYKWHEHFIQDNHWQSQFMLSHRPGIASPNRFTDTIIGTPYGCSIGVAGVATLCFYCRLLMEWDE